MSNIKIISRKTFLKFLVRTGIVLSVSEAKYYFQSGAIEIDGTKVEPETKVFLVVIKDNE